MIIGASKQHLPVPRKVAIQGTGPGLIQAMGGRVEPFLTHMIKTTAPFDSVQPLILFSEPFPTDLLISTALRADEN